jgi:ankyrin repeat protein
MGGIVLEKTLLFSRARQYEFPTVYPYVAGSIFLGTPFHGTTESRAQVLADMAQQIGIGASSDIVEFLSKDSGMLRSLLDDFALLAREIQMRLYCFFEQKESDRVKLSTEGTAKVPYKRQERIVDELSARITSADKCGLPVDHFRLNKFEGAKDPNFTYVSEEIRNTTRDADRILKSRQKEQILALVDEPTYRSMVNHLAKGFQDMESAISGHYKGSQGSKLLGQPAFKDWKQQDTNKILWVHGKAGTGQGAVASSAIGSLKMAREDGSIVTSFYCDQSEQQRRSLLGLLQLIVYQVIDANRDLAEQLRSDSKKVKEAGKQGFDAEATLKVQVLWDALQSMAKCLPGGTIYVIIYGLEQLSPDALDDFLTYMNGVLDIPSLAHERVEIVPIKWMLLSRTGRPNIENILKSRALEIDLEDKDNAAMVSKDLRVQISISVDTLGLPSSLAYFVKRHIHSRAEDNEIYVNLVVQELRNAWIPEQTQHAEIRKLLESFPYGLTNMFEHIRNRVLHPHAEGLEYTKEILRCRICAQVSPTLRDLAIMAGLPKEDRRDVIKLRSYIVQCGAFLTLRGDKQDLENNTVEWINISAQDHLQQYAKKILTLSLQDMQHGIIALRSLEYIYEVLEGKVRYTGQEQNEEDTDAQSATADVDDADANEDDATSTASDEHDDGDDEDSDEGEKDDESDDDAAGGGRSGGNTGAGTSVGETAKYPIRYWVEHAKRAPQDVLDEFNLSHSFWQEKSPARQKWWKLIPDVHSHHNQEGVSALHLAVILKFPALVEYLLEHGRADDTHKDDSLGFQPLYYACEGGDKDIVNALLGAQADINYTRDSNQPAALYAASVNGHREIVNMLLELDANLDATSQRHGTALYAAVSNQDQEITKLLLGRGAKVNVGGGAARRALNIGASVGNLEGVRLLIEHGADIDPDEDYWYGSALGAASRNGHVDVVEYLLSRGWNSSRTMKTYNSFITAAATYRHLDVVETLLKKEKRVHELERALQAASQRGYVPIVKAILAKNSALRLDKAFSSAAYYGRTEVLQTLFDLDINGELRDNYQRRDDALYQATDNEHEETVRLLLEHGANPNAEGPT